MTDSRANRKALTITEGLSFLEALTKDDDDNTISGDAFAEVR